LYGSDAIGGIVNVLTRAPETKAGGSLNMELGSYGWKRILGSANTGLGNNGAFRADVNLTHTDGWRDRSAYDRQSLSLRWDNELNNGALLKTILNYTKIDQQTGAGSNLSENDFRNNPTKNYFGIAFRKVEALRISSNYEQAFGDSLLSITPYLRDNSMDLFASFTLSSDPTISHTENKSYGLLTKWRTDFPSVMNARLIAGLDLERSPGGRQEDSVRVTTTGTGVERVFSDPRNAQRIFDYNVVFKSTSPYLHGEISPTQALRLTAGLRYDKLSYDMNNNIESNINANGGAYALAPSSNPEFSKVSPKLGFTYALNASQNLYGSYNEGFRAPSESQLFRASRVTGTAPANTAQANSRSAASLALNPIKAHQFELGLRGQSGTWNYDTVVYALTKKDDLTSVRDPADLNNRININAGETSHLGVELALGKRLSETLRFDTALSYAIQRYEDNKTANGDFSGKAIPTAPRVLANSILTWKPLETVTQELEWTRIGAYYLDDANTTQYNGHSIFNLRGAWQLKKDLRLFARLNNLTDRRYAESASFSTARTFSPGLPRTLYAGVDVKF
jgi:outer membrane receptor protein involved in Fe transport